MGMESTNEQVLEHANDQASNAIRNSAEIQTGEETHEESQDKETSDHHEPNPVDGSHDNQGGSVPDPVSRAPASNVRRLMDEAIDISEPQKREAINWNNVLASLQREKRLAYARKEQHYINRSLFFFSSSSKLRELAIKIVEWPAFDKMILTLIAINCVMLTFEDPICRCANSDCVAWDAYQQSFFSWDCSAWPTTKAVLEASEVIFTTFFTAEMVVKILARGFALHKHAYLRDPWNWLDFVVVASLLSFLPNLEISILRTFRILRPLRTLSKIKSMKPILITFARSLSSIGDVFALLAFFMTIYGILAIELMSGSLRGYCFFDPRPGRNNFTSAAQSRLESQQTPYLAEQFNVLGGWNVYVQTCRPEDEQAFGSSSGFVCPPMALDGVLYKTTCSTHRWCGSGWCSNDWNKNPWDLGAGLISYDNIGASIVTNFQSMTLASWDDVMYRASNGGNIWLSRLYHTSWIFIGAFVVVQLALAVLAEAFVQAQEEQRTERAREALHDESILQPPSGVVGAAEGAGHQWRGRRFSVVLVGSRRNGMRARDARGSVDAVGGDSVVGAVRKWWISISAKDLGTWWSALRRVARVVAQNPHFQRFMTLVIVVNTVCLALDFHDQPTFEANICRRRCEGDPRLSAEAVARCGGPLFNRSWTFDGQGGGTRPSQSFFCFIANDAEVSNWIPSPPTSTSMDSMSLGGSNCSRQLDINSCTMSGPACGWVEGECRLGLYSVFSFAAQPGATWRAAGKRITLRDLCGSASEITDRCPNYPSSLKDGLEMANYAFTLLFVLELVIKLLAMGFFTIPPEPGAEAGPPGYFSETFNWVDLAIVVASATEACLKLAQSDSGGGGSALTSLRALRIIRMVRLVRSWQGMRSVLRTLSTSLTSIWPLIIMITLFMYIFALLGMQLFGARFRFFKTDVPRSNFDSFFPSAAGHGAFLAIFQIMSAENWNNIMYCAVVGFELTSLNAAFFLVVMLIGNYMFMNLFISILLQGIGQDAGELDASEREELANAPNGAVRALIFMRAGLRFLEARPAARAFGGGLGVSGRIAPTSGQSPPPSAANSLGRRGTRREPSGVASIGGGAGSTGVASIGRGAAGASSLGRTASNMTGASGGRVPNSGFPNSIGRAATSGRLASTAGTASIRGASSERRPSSSMSAAGASAGDSADPDGDVAANLAVRDEVELFGKKIPYSLPDHRAFFVLGTRNPIRIMAAVVARNGAVDMLILMLILVSSITLLMERPDDIVVSSDDNCPPPPAVLNCSGNAAVFGQGVQINCPRTAGPFFGKVYRPCGSPFDSPPCCEIKAKMEVLEVLDMVFTLIFFCEMSLKIIADGLIFHPAAYLRDPWNWLDFVVVIISMMSAFGGASTKDFKALRTLRALRPLRVIKRNPGLKVAVNSLLKSLPAMGNVSLVALFWLAMYSLLGVQLFKGEFHKCYDYSSQFFPGSPIFPLSNNLFSPAAKISGPRAVPTIVECVSASDGSGDAAWVNRPFSFDNFFRGTLALFEMLTTSGWMEMLQSMVDASGVGLMPFPNASPVSALYGVLQIVVGNWVLVNLVVGTVLTTYIRQKQQNDGINPFMTAEDKQWREIVGLMSRLRPQQRAPEGGGQVRRALLKLVQGRAFDYAVRVVIVVSVGVQMVKTHDESPGLSVALFWVNTVVAALFWVEASLKLMAYGPRFYFASELNQFDFVVSLLSLARTALDFATGEYDPTSNASGGGSMRPSLAGRLLHAICVLRAFRLLRFTAGVQRMVKTIVVSVSSIGNLGALTLLIMVIVALLGFNLFYNINLVQDPYQRMGSYGVPYVSYSTFDHTLWLIFRMTTGDFWNGLMYYSAGMMEVNDPYQRCAKTHPDYLGEGCGGPTSAIPFHVLWMVFGQYTLMQLFSAVILENYSELSRGDRSPVPMRVLDEFVAMWECLDPKAKGKIHLEDLPLLLINVSTPLGVRSRMSPTISIQGVGELEFLRRRRQAASITSVLQVIKDLNIPIKSGNMITYRDTFLACAKRVLITSKDLKEDDLALFKEPNDEPEQRSLSSSLAGRRRSSVVAGPKHVLDIKGLPYTAADEYAARSVQGAYREYREIRLQVRKGVHMTMQIPLDGDLNDIVDY